MVWCTTTGNSTTNLPHTMAVFTKNSKLDTFYFLYFLIHIPITILVDSSLAIPSQWRLSVQQKVLDFHLKENKDFILCISPSWLKIAGLVEIFFQLPVFFIGLYSLSKGAKKFYPWILTYGFNAALTTLFCLYEIIIYDNQYAETIGFSVTNADKIKLFWVYFPTFLIPFVIFVDFSIRITHIISEHTISQEDKKKI